MNQTPGRFPADRSEFLELAEETPYAETLRDESALRKIVVDAMKDSEDPLTREIGDGLSGGTLTWSTIATTSAYADFLDQGLNAVRRFDFTRLAEDLEATRPEPARPGPQDRRDDDGEDLWQGLRRKRR